jgi:hypothetical protein
MSTEPIVGLLLSASSRNPEFGEGLIAFCMAVVAVAMLPVWPGIRATLASRSRRFAAGYFTVLTGLVMLIAFLIHDILTPDHPFRDAIGITALTLAVIAMPIWFVVSLRSKASWVRDAEFRGFSGNALPSLIACGWFGCLAVWILKVLPRASLGLVLAAIFGFFAFFVLALITNIFRRPKFLIPVVMRNRSRAPDLVTVIVDRKQDSGWHAWSADLDDMDLDAKTLEEIDRFVRTDLQLRFSNPGQPGKLSLQFLVEEKSAASSSLQPPNGVPKEQLFEAEHKPGGGYTAQSVEQPDLEIRADSLDELLMRAEATGSQTLRLSWSHELAI